MSLDEFARATPSAPPTKAAPPEPGASTYGFSGNSIAPMLTRFKASRSCCDILVAQAMSARARSAAQDALMRFVVGFIFYPLFCARHTTSEKSGPAKHYSLAASSNTRRRRWGIPRRIVQAELTVIVSSD